MNRKKAKQKNMAFMSIVIILVVLLLVVSAYQFGLFQISGSKWWDEAYTHHKEGTTIQYFHYNGLTAGTDIFIAIYEPGEFDEWIAYDLDHNYVHAFKKIHTTAAVNGKNEVEVNLNLDEPGNWRTVYKNSAVHVQGEGIFCDALAPKWDVYFNVEPEGVAEGGDVQVFFEVENSGDIEAICKIYISNDPLHFIGGGEQEIGEEWYDGQYSSTYTFFKDSFPLAVGQSHSDAFTIFDIHQHLRLAFECKGGVGEGHDSVTLIKVITCIFPPPPAPNLPPEEFSISSTPNPSEIGEMIIVTGITTDPENDIITYLFDYGDGGSETIDRTHVYQSIGNYTIKCTANDGNGNYIYTSILHTVTQGNSGSAPPGGNGIPGFELISVICAIGIVFYLTKKKKIGFC